MHPYSLRSLKRVLKTLKLKRNNPDDSTLRQFSTVLRSEIEGTGSNLGCRAMAKRILEKYHIKIPRRMVLAGQRLIDREGVESRKRRILQRRVYRNPGPNFAIHIDGYDKIKTYGFAIHGAIDGFSRRLLWLRVAHTNNDPKVVASYFMEYVKENMAIPQRVIMDAGTENVVVKDIQEAFSHVYDNPVNESVTVTSSPRNQRIERFWRNLRSLLIGSWMEKLHELEETGQFSTANISHINCLRYCLTEYLQVELSRAAREWNEHRIRPVKASVGPCGKPDMMYYTPVVYGSRDYKIDVEKKDVIGVVTAYTVKPSKSGVAEDFSSLCDGLLERNNKEKPDTLQCGIDLCLWLINKVQL